MKDGVSSEGAARAPLSAFQRRNRAQMKAFTMLAKMAFATDALIVLTLIALEQFSPQHVPRWVPARTLQNSVRLMWSTFMFLASCAHFLPVLAHTLMVNIIPRFLPFKHALVYVSGVMELVIAAAAMPGVFDEERVTKPAFRFLALAFLPVVWIANIDSIRKDTRERCASAFSKFLGSKREPHTRRQMIVRAVLQIPLIACAYWCST
uniref:Uncharacterized protein n=2 Tax=Erythrolobus australicus TaxID=1077150 RepID=A0A7S1TMD7_9RHOD|mmetsp:Transcript_5009/g.13501  ORF Transcript_5009/g.13501 Transcript_5009/m.13501 type:complete len:207 (+) Transcript_5009:97-717(+)